MTGVFEEVGDAYILELLPVTNIISVESFSDVTTGVTGTRNFIKEFTYTVNGGAAGPWQPLTNGNLQAIVVADISDVYIFRFRYTRGGVDTTGILIWNIFILDNVQVQPCVVLSTNRAYWDGLYGTDKFLEINEQVIKFNDEWSMPKFNFYTYLVDDNTVPDGKMYLQLLDNAPCTTKDINVLLKALWGNYLVDYQFRIDVDLYDGLRS